MTENKKIKNAKVTEYNGVRYRSRLEAKAAELFHTAGITALYEPYHMEILPGLEYNGEKIRPVTYTPDFVVNRHIIEVKGFPNDAWPLRRKLIIHRLAKNGEGLYFHEVKNEKQINELISEIKNEE